MNGDQKAYKQLQELLTRNYREISQPPEDQRERILAAFVQQEPLRSKRTTTAKPWNARILLATAASLLLVLGLALVINHTSSRVVYGLEAASDRILLVNSLCIRGSHFVYKDDQATEPSHRVPIEYLIERPDKFRITWIGISETEEGPIVRSGLNICDGQQNLVVSEADKQCFGVPISPLNARIDTESMAQHLILLAVLGPPDVAYKKVRSDTIKTRHCDVYEANLDHAGQAQVATLWFDSTSGYPLRVTHSQVLSSGTRRVEIELNEITVNPHLAKEQFQFNPPQDYKTVMIGPQPTQQDLPLEITSTGSGATGATKLESWQALRISDNAAILVWRRSTPEPQTDGTVDWLDHVEITHGDSNQKLNSRHRWLLPPSSAEAWNWSLIALPSGHSFGRSPIKMLLRAKRSQTAIDFIPLQLADKDLEQILVSTLAPKLPPGVPKPSLEELRSQASKLSGAGETTEGK